MNILKDHIKNDVQLSKAFGNKLDSIFQSVIVFTNEKMILKIRNAPEDIKSRIVKADMLCDYIKKIDEQSPDNVMSNSLMNNLVDWFKCNSDKNPRKYLDEFKWLERFVKIRKTVRIISLILFVIVFCGYSIYFRQFQMSKLASDSPTSDLIELLKLIFMIYYPLGIATGIIAFLCGLVGQSDFKLATIGKAVLWLINIITVVLSIIADVPHSFMDGIFSLIIICPICFVWSLLSYSLYFVGKFFSKIIS